MTAGRVVLGGALAALLMAALGALTRVPFTEHEADDALVRLAWKSRSERVRACRALSAEEIARLPRHMRTREVCEGRLRPFLLEVGVDGAALVRDTVRAAGATSDRPLFVFREVALAPGRHALQVRFTPLGAAAPGSGEGARSEEPRGLALDTVITLGPRHVALVTLDGDRGALVVR